MNLNILMGIVVLILHGHTTEAASVELQSYNIPDYYVQTAHRVQGGTVTLQRQTQPEIWKIISPGLCNRDGSVSIRIGLQDSNIYYDTEMDSFMQKAMINQVLFSMLHAFTFDMIIGFLDMLLLRVYILQAISFVISSFS